MGVLVIQFDDVNKPDNLGRIFAQRGIASQVISTHLGQRLPRDLAGYQGLVILGGHMGANEDEQYPQLGEAMGLIKAAHEKDLAVLGICLGAQLIAKALGGRVEKMDKPQIGFANVVAEFPAKMESMFAGITWENMMFHCHQDQVTRLPEGATPMQTSEDCKVQAFSVGMTTWAFQYHPEWTVQTIQAIAETDFVKNAKLNENQFQSQLQSAFAEYRRVGDRLLERLAMTLLPVGVC